MVSCVCVQVPVLKNDKGNCSPNSFFISCFYITFFLQMLTALPCLLPASDHRASLKYLS